MLLRDAVRRRWPVACAPGFESGYFQTDLSFHILNSTIRALPPFE